MNLVKYTISIVLVLTLAISAFSRAEYDPSSVADQLKEKLSTAMKSSVDWPVRIAVQMTPNLNAAFKDNGQFGASINDTGLDPSFAPASFESPPGSDKEHLFAGAFWIGAVRGHDTLVSTGIDGWDVDGYEFNPDDMINGSINPAYSFADVSYRAVYYDTLTNGVDPDASGRPHIPIGLKVTTTSMAWNDPALEDIVIYTSSIKNISDSTIEEMYIGLYYDTDIGDHSRYNISYDDIVHADYDNQIIYAFDDNGDPDASIFTTHSTRSAFGFKMLDLSVPAIDTNFNWWISSGNIYDDYGPRKKGTPEDPLRVFRTGTLGTPSGDHDKYYMLSHREWDFNQIYTGIIDSLDTTWVAPSEIVQDLGFGFDSRFLYSLGPFTLAPDSSIYLTYANFVNANLHSDVRNLENLPLYPDTYLSHLYLDDVYYNAELAQNLFDSLYSLPTSVVGLEVNEIWRDSAHISWDKIQAETVEAINVYLYEVQPSDMPYEGVVPPWLKPSNYQLIDQINPAETEYLIDSLEPYEFYMVAVSTVINGQANEPQNWVPFVYHGDKNISFNPTTIQHYYINEPFTLRWEISDSSEIDHFNIYKFDPQDNIFKNANDRQYQTESDLYDLILPSDSFDIDGTLYYYYQTEPFATVAGNVFEYTDQNPIDSGRYIVTWVSSTGLESYLRGYPDPTNMILCATVYEYSHPEKDFLVLTRCSDDIYSISQSDSIRAFYSNILDGTYSYDYINLFDSTTPIYELFDYHDFTKYRNIILDDDNFGSVLDMFNSFNGFYHFYLSGGRFLKFGPDRGYLINDYYPSIPLIYVESLENNDLRKYNFVDSVMQYSITAYFYLKDTLGTIDSLYGFYQAIPENLEYPLLQFNSEHYFKEPIIHWPMEAPPAVDTYFPRDSAEVLYTCNSLHPATSLVHGNPVGIKSVGIFSESYLFGFHLWYMEHDGARALLDKITGGITTDVGDNPTGPNLPSSFNLAQNYPNPFNPTTKIKFDLPRSSIVTLEIYNILGQKVKTVINNESLTAGSHLKEWNGKDDSNNSVASGIYLYRLSTDEFSSSKKMMLLK